MSKYRVVSNLTENVCGSVVIWKGVAVLVGAAALVALGVTGLALVMVPDEPTFAEGFVGTDDSEEEVEFVPTAVGALLEITGSREATVTLDRTVGGPSYGIGDSTTRVFFDRDPLAIGQMSHDGLAFFPDPEDCEFTPGEHDEDTGLVAVTISCLELVDIRGNGSITLEGFAALPADLVIELDLPETGGVIMVGDEQWEIVDPLLFVGPSFQGQGGGAADLGLSLNPKDPNRGLFLAYDIDTERLTPATIFYDETVAEMTGTCMLTDEEVMILNPQTQFRELTIDCENVEVGDLGTVEITGSVVYQKVYFAES